MATATNGKVYVANGAGSGTWALPYPNGSDTASSGSYFVSNGAGGGSWIKDPFGYIYFENIAAPYVLAYPAVYTKAAPTTVATGISYLVTEGTNARLTYLGPGEVMDISCDVSFDQSSGANRDIRMALYKNGVVIPGSISILTTVSGEKRFIHCSAVSSLATNDYIELYVKNDGAGGNVNIYTYTLEMDPH